MRCDFKSDDKADGKNDGKSAKSDHFSAVFCSFPYVRIRKTSRHQCHDDRSYPEMSLLQSMYPFESTDERDSEQTTCMIPDNMGKIVTVPQIWTLSFGQNLLTCSPSRLSEVRSRHLQILGPKESASFLRYRDRDGQLFYLPISTDTTLFVSLTSSTNP
jgi:hypothetical protein